MLELAIAVVAFVAGGVTAVTVPRAAKWFKKQSEDAKTHIGK